MPQLLKENEVSYYLGEKHIYPKVGGGSNAGIPIVEHTASETTVSIEPNAFHIWPQMSSLNITLATPTDNTTVNLYMFEFTSGATATTLSLPSTITWENGVNPTIEANTRYEITIQNNGAKYSSFPTA